MGNWFLGKKKSLGICLFILTMKFSICIHFFLYNMYCSTYFRCFVSKQLTQLYTDWPLPGFCSPWHVLHEGVHITAEPHSESPGCWVPKCRRANRAELGAGCTPLLQKVFSYFNSSGAERYGLMLGSAYTHSSHPLLFRLPF